MSLGEVSYNGVTIDFPKVSVNARPVYDNSDRVEGSYILTFNISGVVCRESGSQSIPTLIKDLKTALETPRRNFQWIVRDVPSNTDRVMYDIIGEGTAAAEQYLDRNWGPKPRGVQVEQIPGGGSARVKMIIEAVVALCDMPRDIEELWWEVTSSYDRDFTCTRTITGQIRTLGQVDYNTASQIFQNYTDLFPKVPNNFQREGFQHTLNKAGNVINFTCVDRQVWRTLPRPMTDGAATFRMDFQGAKILKTLSGYFKAPHDVPKNTIAEFVFVLINKRFPSAVEWSEANPDQSGADFFINFSIVNHEFENRMDFNVTALSPIKEVSGSELFAPGKNLNAFISGGMFEDVANVIPDPAGLVWDQSDGISESGKDSGTPQNTVYEDRGMLGTAKLIPQVVSPFDVCEVDDLPSTGVLVGVDQEFGNEDGPLQVPSDEQSVPSDDVISPEHTQYPYTSYVEVYHVITEYHNRIIPIPSVVEKEANLASSPKDVIQQMCRPTVTLVRAGSARRLGRFPEIPDLKYYPYWGGDDADPDRVNMVRRDIRTHQPRLMPDGQTLEFQLSWNMTLLLPDAEPYSNPIIPPINPQLNAASPILAAQFDGSLIGNGPRQDLIDFNNGSIAGANTGDAGEVTIVGDVPLNAPIGYEDSAEQTPSP